MHFPGDRPGPDQISGAREFIGTTTQVKIGAGSAGTMSTGTRAATTPEKVGEQCDGGARRHPCSNRTPQLQHRIRHIRDCRHLKYAVSLGLQSAARVLTSGEQHQVVGQCPAQLCVKRVRPAKIGEVVPVTEPHHRVEAVRAIGEGPVDDLDGDRRVRRLESVCLLRCGLRQLATGRLVLRRVNHSMLPFACIQAIYVAGLTRART